MPVREIALALEMPAGTVKSHLFRARRHLKERLLERYTMEELQP
jgi:DNA-directed RNA polymerase specialized sigma24 family protein